MITWAWSIMRKGGIKSRYDINNKKKKKNNHAYDIIEYLRHNNSLPII